jgi:hypothetical protein
MIGGGYAFIVDRGRTQLNVASIRPPADNPYGFKEHRLTLFVIQGNVDNAASLPSSNIALPGDLPIDGWNFTGSRVEVWPGGQPLTTGLTGLNAPDRAYLPNIPALVGKPLSSNWPSPSQIEARLTLRAGLLSVSLLDLSEGFITLTRQDGAAIPAQQFSGGIQGLHCDFENLNVPSVTLALFGLNTPDGNIRPGNESGKVIIAPDNNNQIVLQFNAREPGMPKEGEVLKEFGLFYELLDPKPDYSEDFIPVWSARGPVNVTPGSECPPGFYEIP